MERLREGEVRCVMASAAAALTVGVAIGTRSGRPDQGSGQHVLFWRAETATSHTRSRFPGASTARPGDDHRRRCRHRHLHREGGSE